MRSKDIGVANARTAESLSFDLLIRRGRSAPRNAPAVSSPKAAVAFQKGADGRSPECRGAFPLRSQRRRILRAVLEWTGV